MDVVGDRRRRRAALGEPVASRAERRVSGPTRRSLRRPRWSPVPHAWGAALVGHGVVAPARGVEPVVAVPAQRGRGASSTTGSDGGEARRSRGLDALAAALDDAVTCRGSESRAPRSRATRQIAAFERLCRDWSAVRRARRRALSAATARLPGPASIRPPSTRCTKESAVVATPFYLALQITRRERRFAQRRGRTDRRRTARRPARRPARRSASKRDWGSGASRSRRPVDSSNSPEMLQYAVSGQRLFDVRAAFRCAQGEIAARITEIATGSRRPRVRAGA